MKHTVELSHYLQPEMVADVAVKDKSELLDKLISLICASNKITDPMAVRKAVLEREKGLSTGVGNGIAIPHARTKGVTDFVITVARLKNPIDYGSDDKVPVFLVFLIVATDKQDDEYIRLLSRLVLRLRNEEFIQKIISAENSTDIYNLIKTTK